MGKKKLTKKSAKKFKAISVCLVISCFFIGLFLRIGYLMLFKSSEYKAIAAEQQTSEIKINARRGKILDTNGMELAVSADVYRIDLDLNTLRDTLKSNEKKQKSPMTMDELAPQLAQILNMKTEDVSKILNSTLKSGLPAGSAILKRRVEKPEIDKIKALKLRGIIISSDTKRFYPNDNFLSQVIGHTNVDGVGLSGVELYYNKDLTGIAGRKIYETDSKSNQLPYEESMYTKPVDGKNVVLTIDSTIQNYAEKVAQKALTDNKAKAVSIMVMDPNNGEILAMTSKPDYNLNDPSPAGKSSAEILNLWKNNSVQNTFEPGSIFKVITAATAIETGIGINDKYVCNGSLQVAKGTNPIRCWEPAGHGTETFAQILDNSCNVGFMELGAKLGKQNLVDFTKKMGFGQKTGIDLPGEASGIVLSPDKIGPVELATFAFGQSISVTQVQYMAAFNAIANGGTWIRPHIMKEISYTDENNNNKVERKFTDFGKKTVVDKSLTDQLKLNLEEVVTKGVGLPAYIPGYRIGGKTGTAQKVNVENGTYAAGKYISSFAGMAPVDNPKISMVITVDEPDESKYYAGQTAAPAAKDLFDEIFNYLIVQGKMEAPKNVPVNNTQIDPKTIKH
ncbi:stage V sporulation protein D [Clostridium omnivorum]|uniref:Stage V sporulation protein D n=1 Tax=Clostridium omnivorum TaxID=1604902 RepID=A0ABQ5N6N8_9CLOT|nr:stage V sporulation protein D [Clostridium sp. E14]GLC30801.1 stage V sporulation protein D [Clostridium sp. E14]